MVCLICCLSRVRIRIGSHRFVVVDQFVFCGTGES